jgi:hypothetical protein
VQYGLAAAGGKKEGELAPCCVLVALGMPFVLCCHMSNVKI